MLLLCHHKSYNSIRIDNKQYPFLKPNIMTFSKIPFREELKNELISWVTQDKMPHATLLIGTPGTGSLAFALALANYLMCENRMENDACGKCSHCIKSMKFVHPDIHFSFPVVKIKSNNNDPNISDDHLVNWRSALSKNPFMELNDWMQIIKKETVPNISVAEINRMIQKLGLKAYEGGKKILVIWLPEYLGKEGNRLLKLIEEPTDDTFILLATEDPNMILGTILSRCRIVKIPPYSTEEIAHHITSSLHLTNEKALEYAKISGSNINNISKIVANVDQTHAQMVVEWLRICYKNDVITLKKWNENFAAQNKEFQKNFLRYVLLYFQQLHFILVTGKDPGILNAEEIAIARRLLPILNIDNIAFITEVINATIIYVERHINIKIVFFIDSLKIGQQLRNTSSQAAKST